MKLNAFLAGAAIGLFIVTAFGIPILIGVRKER